MYVCSSGPFSQDLPLFGKSFWGERLGRQNMNEGEKEQNMSGVVGFAKI